MPEISIIVPVYKAEAYLPACIDSILNQTFQNFEVLLVDDGSPDRCGEICEDYARKDSRVRVLHQENQGQAAARNHAMAIARGKWLCFVDSDDWIHPQMVECLYRQVKEGNAAVSMCKMLESVELPENFFEAREASFRIYTMEENTLANLFDRGEYPGWVACAKLIPKALVEAYPFREGRVYEDNEAVCRWICQGKALAVTEEKLYFYRTNPISTTQSAFSPKKLDYLWALESILHFYREQGYERIVERFSELYAEAAAGFYRVTRWELATRSEARKIRRDVRRLFGREGFPLAKPQYEDLLDAMHPKLIRLYWPLDGAVRTIRENGIRGLTKKIAAKVRKGDRE